MKIWEGNEILKNKEKGIMETNKFQQNYSLKISFYFTWLKHHNMKFPFYKFQNYPCNLNQENKSKLSIHEGIRNSGVDKNCHS